MQLQGKCTSAAKKQFALHEQQQQQQQKQWLSWECNEKENMLAGKNRMDSEVVARSAFSLFSPPKRYEPDHVEAAVSKQASQWKEKLASSSFSVNIIEVNCILLSTSFTFISYLKQR